MSKGIIYCMTTVVPGIIKIGKTETKQFENRMKYLEKNGYNQIGGFKRRFAIEVDEYDTKEILLHELFSKSRIQNTELFAVNADLVVQLLSSFEGKEIYPKSMSKEETFDTATDEIQNNIVGNNLKLIPNGTYILNDKKVKAKMKVKDGKFIVLKGSECLPCKADWMPETRKNAKIEDGILKEDIECNSPSTAGWIVFGHANNGWFSWKNKDGVTLDYFRKNQE